MFVGVARYGRRMQDYLAKPLSPSRMNSFLDCELLFRYRTIDRLPERPGHAAFKGTLLHSVLEDMFELAPEERSLERVAQMLEPALQRHLAAEPELGFAVDESLVWPDGAASPSEDSVAAFLESARLLASNYFKLEDPQILMPSEREHHVEVELPSGLKIHGIVDRIERTPTGDVRISDYKTGKAPGERWMDKYWFQMKFYALLLQKSEGVLARELRLIFLGNTQLARKAPSETEMQEFEIEVTALAGKIRRAVESGSFTPKPSKLCDWCAHQSLCPAKGGTLLPLPYTPTER